MISTTDTVLQTELKELEGTNLKLYTFESVIEGGFKDRNFDLLGKLDLSKGSLNIGMLYGDIFVSGCGGPDMIPTLDIAQLTPTRGNSNPKISFRRHTSISGTQKSIELRSKQLHIVLLEAALMHECSLPLEAYQEWPTLPQYIAHPSIRHVVDGKTKPRCIDDTIEIDLNSLF